MSSEPIIVDLRSDTLTQPDEPMRAAMAAAPLGDDVLGEDPSINLLEQRFAALCGKAAALFVTSGTQGNLIAAIVHARMNPSGGLFSEIIMGDKAHTNKWEVGGASIVGGIPIRTAPLQDDGTFCLSTLAGLINDGKDIHCARTAAVFVENTNNMLGGKVLPMDYLFKVRALCDGTTGASGPTCAAAAAASSTPAVSSGNGIALHCDGARVWNAAAALSLPMQQVLAPFDTASICLAKGLGAPVGAMVVGPSAFIANARKVRKMLGGGMRQGGVLAAAALYALDHRVQRISDDHRLAQRLMQGLRAAFPSDHPAAVTGEDPQSNIVLFKAAATDADRDVIVQQCKLQGLKMGAWTGVGSVRAVTHFGHSDSTIDRAIAIVKAVKEQMMMEKK